MERQRLLLFLFDLAGSVRRGIRWRPADPMDRPQRAHSGWCGNTCLLGFDGSAACQSRGCPLGGWSGGHVACPGRHTDQATPPLPGLHKLGDWSYALYLVHASTIWIVYHFWPTAAGAGLALLFAVAAALLVAASFGMLDVWLHWYLKNMVDALGKDDRRRRVNVYAGVFILASLIAAFVA
jgi:peptidoglycan/LPS O-acetylase OafA/YrhL